MTALTRRDPPMARVAPKPLTPDADSVARVMAAHATQLNLRRELPERCVRGMEEDLAMLLAEIVAQNRHVAVTDLAAMTIWLLDSGGNST